MKLGKITRAAPRWYDDACGTAHGLELIGERWTLLVMRELMFGPRRFGDLRASLPGLSANVLTQRLEGMEASGLVVRRKLPPPASVQVYDLTDWGREAEVVITALGRWAVRSPGHDPTLPLSAASMMLSFRAMFDAGAAAGEAAMRLGFLFGPESFVVEVAEGALTARRGETDEADVVVSGSPEAVARAVYDGAAEGLAIEGRREVFERFAGFFALPAKVAP